MTMAPIRVLVVDDTVVVRRLVSDVLSECADIEVVGTASNGRTALGLIAALKPDVVTLDVEMPVLDGLATLAELRPAYPTLPVIMFSTMTERGASATLMALELGANDYVTKPSAMRDREASLAAVRTSLVPLVRLWGRRTARPMPVARTSAAPSVPRTTPIRIASRTPVRGVVIGVSTGGPPALSALIPALPADLSVPVLVVQHMPPVFTRLLAERLNELSVLPVHEAKEGMLVEPGHVYVAEGSRHLVLDSRAGVVRLVLDDGPPENSCRPSVDVTLRSAAQVWGMSTLAVILTGMGSDGLEGVRVLRETGARIVAQDEASSVVWGMPGVVARAGLADEVIPLDDISSAIVGATHGAHSLIGATAR
jgi:two-component system chemotaxis response regulator CheB